MPFTFVYRSNLHNCEMWLDFGKPIKLSYCAYSISFLQLTAILIHYPCTAPLPVEVYHYGKFVWILLIPIIFLSKFTNDQSLIWYVTGPTNIDHVSANYTELYSLIPFVPNILSHSISCRRKPIKFCSNDKDFAAVV